MILNDLLDVVRTSPQTLAIRDSEKSVTYQQLWDQAGVVARALHAAGCPAGGYVVLGLQPGRQWAAGLVGVWRANAVPVLSNVEHPASRLRKVADSADYVLALAAESAVAWPDYLERIVWPGKMATVHDDIGTSPEVPPSAACVLHTSGTSGTPKPVVLEHDGLAHRIARLRAVYEIGRPRGSSSASRVAQAP